MFKEGDLIRRITKDGDGEIVRVLEDEILTAVDIHVAIGNDDSEEWVTICDYELVTDKQKTLASTDMEHIEACHDALNNFVNAVHAAQAAGLKTYIYMEDGTGNLEGVYIDVTKRFERTPNEQS